MKLLCISRLTVNLFYFVEMGTEGEYCLMRGFEVYVRLAEHEYLVAAERKLS